jgi:predicted transcriptional regulator YheO
MSQPTEVFLCKLGNSEARCSAPGCICIQYGQNEDECDCRCIRDIYKTTPDNSREVSEIDEFIDKARENIETAIFTINMAEMPLSEVADFLQIFVSEIEVPESIKSKTVSLSADMQTMKEIIHDLGLEMSQNKQ